MDLGTLVPGENATALVGLTVADAPTAKVISVTGSLAGEDTEGGSLPPQAASETILIAEPLLAVSQRVNRATWRRVKHCCMRSVIKISALIPSRAWCWSLKNRRTRV